ncbi:alpha/beta hydrolase [Clostridium sp. chh4-2]|uniref:alpha/beta fold hydrolase n=1 Tax=Clostridium sp. chh4-2 TaxID=2067550 RepID=UPI000CCE383A|nr:alpha/beta hydrolase [Clostridium sp. chh4-2]PNV63994.1 alpha/beta hydrolase [Clostridium sp. chh4-2]
MIKGYLTTSDRARIYYEDRGTGIPILFVPGHMCTTKFFEKNAEVLEKDYRVVTFDPRGFGNSSKVLHGNDIERHADDIKELIDLLDLKDVILLGWSLEGSTVVTYADKYNSYRLKGLGLIDCCLFPFSPEDWNSYNSKNYNMDDWNQKYRLWITDPEVYFDNFIQRIDKYLTQEEISMVRTEISKTPPWIGFAIHSDWCHTNAEPLLKNLTVPVYIASGCSKGHTPSMGRHYNEVIPTYHELHEFENGGHILFWVEHEKFNRTLGSFISKIS